MGDYISEANKYMYDDNYVVESTFKLNGKEYSSKKEAEADLKKKGLRGFKLADTLSHGKMELKDVLKHSEQHINKIGKEIDKHENNMDRRGRKGDLANEFDFHRNNHEYDHDEHKALHNKIKSAHEKGENVSDNDIKKLKKHIEKGHDMITTAKENEKIRDNW